MRMGADPRSSVTDSFGKVHGLRNVYVGGASQFVTGSSVNPTLTLYALALRTAEHLVKRFENRADGFR
jgi:choline dehydrogenase-like flavoprotein